MSMTSVSLSCAIRPARSGGSSGNATAGPAAGSREEGGVQSTFGAGAVPATPRTPGVPQPSSAAQAVTPKVTGRNVWGGATLRTVTSGGRVANRASIVLCTKKGLGGAAVPIIRIPGAARGPYPAGRGGAMSDGSRVRLDRWLWAARFFKTRALAAAAIGGGKVEVGGARAKRAKLLAVGDRLRIRRGPFEYRVVVRGLSEHRGPPAAAAALYEEDAEGRRLRERLCGAPRGAPSLPHGGEAWGLAGGGAQLPPLGENRFPRARVGRRLTMYSQ